MSQERRVRRRGRRGRQRYRNTREQQSSQQSREYTLAEIVNYLADNASKNSKKFKKYLKQLLNVYEKNPDTFIERLNEAEISEVNLLKFKKVTYFLFVGEEYIGLLNSGNEQICLNSQEHHFLKGIFRDLVEDGKVDEEFYKIVEKLGFPISEDVLNKATLSQLCSLLLSESEESITEFSKFFSENEKAKVVACLRTKIDDEDREGSSLIHEIALHKNLDAFLIVQRWANENAFELEALLNEAAICLIGNESVSCVPIVLLILPMDNHNDTLFFNKEIFDAFLAAGARLDITHQKWGLELPLIEQIIHFCASFNDFRVYEALKENDPDLIKSQLRNFPTFLQEEGKESKGNFLHFLLEGQSEISGAKKSIIEYLLENESWMLDELGTIWDCTPLFLLLKRKEWGLAERSFGLVENGGGKHFINNEGLTPLNFLICEEASFSDINHLIKLYNEYSFTDVPLWEIKSQESFNVFFFCMLKGNRPTFKHLVSLAQEEDPEFSVDHYLFTEEGATPFYCSYELEKEKRRNRQYERNSDYHYYENKNFLDLVKAYPEHFNLYSEDFPHVIYNIIVSRDKRTLFKLRNLEKKLPALNIDWSLKNSENLTPIEIALSLDDIKIFSFLLQVLYQKEQLFITSVKKSANDNDFALPRLEIYNSDDSCLIMTTSHPLLLSEQLNEKINTKEMGRLKREDFENFATAIFYNKAWENLKDRKRKEIVQKNLAEERRLEKEKAARIREENRRNRQLEREERQKEESTIQSTLFFAEESSEEALLPESLFISDLDLEIPVTENVFRPISNAPNCLLYIDRTSLIDHYGEDADRIIQIIHSKGALQIGKNHISSLNFCNGKLKIDQENEIDVLVGWKLKLNRGDRLVLYTLKGEDASGKEYMLLITGAYENAREFHQRAKSKTYRFDWGGMITDENSEESSYELT
jgi:hypothetical protein